jgi:hypothetical protein
MADLLCERCRPGLLPQTKGQRAGVDSAPCAAVQPVSRLILITCLPEQQRTLGLFPQVLVGSGQQRQGRLVIVPLLSEQRKGVKCRFRCAAARQCENLSQPERKVLLEPLQAE